MNYNELLAKLRKDIRLLNIKRHKLTKEQISMLDFIEAKTSYSQHTLSNNRTIRLSRGNIKHGFEHILNQHYQETSNGKLNTREILNLWSVIEKGSKTTDFEQIEKGDYAFRLFKVIPPNVTEDIKIELKEKVLNKEEDISTDVEIEIKKEINKYIEENTENVRLMLVYFEENKTFKILTYYSDRKFEAIGDLS